MRFRQRHELAAEPAAAPAVQQVDALDLEIVGRGIGQRQVRGRHPHVAHRRAARFGFDQPQRTGRIGQPRPVARRAVRVRAVGHDCVAGKHAGEGLQERRLPDQRQRRFVARLAAPDVRVGLHGPPVRAVRCAPRRLVDRSQCSTWRRARHQVPCVRCRQRACSVPASPGGGHTGPTARRRCRGTLGCVDQRVRIADHASDPRWCARMAAREVDKSRLSSGHDKVATWDRPRRAGLRISADAQQLECARIRLSAEKALQGCSEDGGVRISPHEQGEAGP